MADTQQPQPTKRESVRFQFIESRACRTIHVDGAWGAVGPIGNIYMSVFSERHPTPQFIEHRITPEGRLGEETDREIFDGVTREIEAHLVFSVSAAQSIRDWLTQKIEEAERAITETRER